MGGTTGRSFQDSGPRVGRGVGLASELVGGIEVASGVLEAGQVGTFASSDAKRVGLVVSFGLCEVSGVCVSAIRSMPSSAVRVARGVGLLQAARKIMSRPRRKARAVVIIIRIIFSLLFRV
ncbi:MAG: hypothetical protein A2W35_07970 [Chloroflexi bacterium RBG_16_57_11]|nr:MAG: hypothetical protein A2W35_07970 [Chloroflexi bacterium RBG_16_57_11]